MPDHAENILLMLLNLQYAQMKVALRIRMPQDVNESLET